MGKTKDGQAPDRLTDQQREFCEEYAKHFNATQAAKKAGYTHADKQGPRLLTNPAVIEYLTQTQKKTAKRHQIDRDWIIKRLRRAIEFDPADLIEISEYGKPQLKKQIPRGALKHIAFSYSSGEGYSFSFRHRDSYEKLLELMARINGITSNGHTNNPGTSDVTRERVLGALRKRKGR